MKTTIRFIVTFLFVSVAVLSVRADEAQGGGSPLQASNLGNPNISVIGWFQGEAGHRQKNPTTDAFQLKEAELGFQAVVDPYAKADFFISVHEDEIDLEEGYINWFNLPADLALKLGKFRANFGKFNRTHPGETPFADRPLAAENYFGEEGLSGTGASLSWQVPISLFLMDVNAEVFNTPDTSEVPTFGKARKKDLTYVGRVSGFFDLTESLNLNLGSSYASGAAGEELDTVTGSSTTLRSALTGFDATFRWKNPRRAIYRSAFWQTEVFTNRRDITSTTHENSFGLFSHVEYQFARRWRAGGRYDYSETPLDKNVTEKGGLLYITFTPTEFSLVSLQGRHMNFSDGTEENIGFLKTTFNIGPHGAHPF
jgi:hypothetical protein